MRIDECTIREARDDWFPDPGPLICDECAGPASGEIEDVGGWVCDDCFKKYDSEVPA